MLQISVFFQKTICFQTLLFDLKTLIKFKIFQNVILFFVYINNILKLLIQGYKDAELERIPLNQRFTKKYLEQILLLINSIFENTDIYRNSEIFISNDKHDTDKRVWANIYLICVSVIYSIPLITTFKRGG